MKKCISMLMAVLMLLTMIPTAFAADSVYEYTQPCVVDYFNSFNGYVKTSGTITGAPEGFEAFLSEPNRLKNLTSGTNEDGSNTYLKFSYNNGGAGIMMPFDETIRTGKLHISFDMKIENLQKTVSFLLAGHNNYANDNPLDLMCKANNSYGIDFSYSKIMDINDTKVDNETEDTLRVGGNKNSQINVDTKIKDAWTKYDIEINFSTKKVMLWLNGSKHEGDMLTSGFNRGLKSLYFLLGGTGENSSIYLDNLFIKHYPDGEYTAPEMVVDYAGTAVPNSNAIINVAFSEACKVVNDAQQPYKDDFALQNIVDNTETPLSKITKNNGNIKLEFDEISMGTYRIVCKKGTDYEGLISKKVPVCSNTFSTAAAAQNIKAKNVLIEEDFENYSGGMPVNAEASDGTKTCTENTLTAIKEENRGTALKMTGDGQQIIYQLPYALTGDGFTYEFDVKNNGGGWYTGLLTADALSGKKSISKALYDQTAGKTDVGDPSEEQYKNDLTSYKMQTNAIGGAGTSIKYAKAKSAAVDNVITDLTANDNAWTHIKVDVDLNVGSYTVTIDESSQTVYVDADRFRPITRYMKKTIQNGETTETKWVRTWDYGIKGISLGRYADSEGASATEVYFDNLTVYNNDSYNDYQDFNSTPRTDEVSYQMPGWLNQIRPYQGANVSLADGVNSATDTTDKALKIEYKGSGNSAMMEDIFTHRFNREVSGETPFAVEFDLKQDENNTYNDFKLGLLQSNQLYTTYENTRTGNGCVAESLSGIDKGYCNDGKKYHDSGLMLAAQKDSDGKTYLYSANAQDLSAIGSKVEVGQAGVYLPVDLSEGKWNHFKITVYPRANSTYFSVQISAKNEGENTTAGARTFNLTREGVNFSAFFIKPAKYSDATGSVTYLDNFKVYEIAQSNVNSPAAAVSNVYATEVNSVNTATGEKTLLGDGFKANNHNIEINFSAPIKSAEDIKVYDAAGGTVKETNATLSEDKKTATVSFVDNDKPSVGDKLTLVIPDTIQPDCDSKLSRVEPSSVLFEVKAADAPELKVEDFRLYKYYKAGQNGITSKTDFAANWVPVADTELKDLTEDDKFKFIAKGYNTGAETDVLIVRAEKDPTTAVLTNSEAKTAKAEYGKFTIEFEPFTLDGANGSMSTYLWELSGLKPLCKKYGITVTKAQTETTEE